MHNDEVVFRPYRPGDEVAINRTFNEVFHLQRPLAEWAWKFPPVDGCRPIMLGFRDDELLTHYAGIGCRFQVDDTVVNAAQIVDVFSTRAARRRFSRRGVWVQTVDAFFETFGASGAYPVLFGFPGRRALRLGVLQLGYDAVTPQPIVYLCRAPHQRRRSMRRLLYRAELARDWEPYLDRLWSRVRRSYPVGVVRDAARALVRLAGRGEVTYHRWLIFPRFGDQPVAFGAFRTDQGRCRWVELLWDRCHPGALEQLSHVGARLADQAEAHLEELWLNGDPEGRQRLEELGFECRPEPQGLVMVARSFDPAVDVSAFDGRVYLTMADADLV